MISRNTLCGPILPKIKKMEELLIFDQNHGLTPLQKCNFFLNFLLLLPVVYEGVSFCLEYRKTHISSLFPLK